MSLKSLIDNPKELINDCLKTKDIVFLFLITMSFICINL